MIHEGGLDDSVDFRVSIFSIVSYLVVVEVLAGVMVGLKVGYDNDILLFSVRT